MEELMIKINNVSKVYKLGQIGGTTLRDELQRKMARIRHQEDPTKCLDYTYSSNENEMFYALNNISFEVKKGERIGVIGHNGAGKSTLLKLISRVTAPSSGVIGLNGRVSSMLEVGTGFHPELTGRENIYMNGAILGMTKKEIDSKIEDIIDFSECRQFIDTPVKRYSSGMYVKLAFAVAAHLDSEIMLMDEVLAVGDMAFQKKCLDKMYDVSKTKDRTILYVSHNMSTIRQLCERCIVLDHGKIVFSGDVEKSISYYMGNVNNELPVYYSLNDAQRPSKEHGAQVRITSLEFINKKEAVFTRGEKMEFEIIYKSTIKVAEARLYFTLQNLKGETIGLVDTREHFGLIEQGEIKKVILEMDISNLAPGTYCFLPDLYSRNEFGNHFSFDRPNKEIRFMVSGEKENTLRWQPNHFGNVYLPQLNVKK